MMLLAHGYPGGELLLVVGGLALSALALLVLLGWLIWQAGKALGWWG